MRKDLHAKYGRNAPYAAEFGQGNYSAAHAHFMEGLRAGAHARDCASSSEAPPSVLW